MSLRVAIIFSRLVGNDAMNTDCLLFSYPRSGILFHFVQGGLKKPEVSEPQKNFLK